MDSPRCPGLVVAWYMCYMLRQEWCIVLEEQGKGQNMIGMRKKNDNIDRRGDEVELKVT